MDSPMSSDFEFDFDKDPSGDVNETILSLINSNFSLVEIEAALAKPDVQIDYQSTSNGSFLYAAIVKRKVDIVKLLIAKGADVTNKIIKFKNHSSLKLVAKLLKSNPNNGDLQSIKKLLEDSQPGTSSIGSKGIKRKASQSSIPDHIDRSVVTNTLQKSFKIDNEYNASGLKLSFHGVVFQAKLLMLFIHRAIRNEYEFRLATEMNIAEKFDDAVLEYFKPNDPNKRNFILVQAKHKIDCQKSKITITDLKSEAGDFSLQKYFISFCKIKRNAHFRHSGLNKYFIVTNTDFDFIGNETQESNGLIDKWRQFIQRDFTENKTQNSSQIIEKWSDDDILCFKTVDFKAKNFKLCDNSEGELKKMMKQNLLESALKTNKIMELKSVSMCLLYIAKLTNLPDLDRLSKKLKYLQDEIENRKVDKKEFIDMAKETSELSKNIFAGNIAKNNNENMANKLSESSKGKKEVTKKELEHMTNQVLELNKSLDEARIRLANRKSGETIDIKIQKKDVLREMDNLLKIISDECNRLKNEIQKFENQNSNEYNELKEDKQLLKEDERKLKEMTSLSDLNPNEVKKRLDKVREASVIEMALDNAKFDEHFVEFIKYFRIVTNYPNESELGALIGDELKDVFNLLNADLAYAEFERDVFEILKYYKGGKAKYHDKQKALNAFDKIKRDIAALMISGLGRSYPEKLRQYNIKFNKTIAELDKFLEPESKTQIFQLITQSTRLGAIKVLQSLDAIDEYRKKKDSFIFMRLRTLLRERTQEEVLKSFTSEKSYNLIVVEIQSKSQENEEYSRNQCRFEYYILEKLLGHCPFKKVIVIDSKERHYDFESETKDEQISFADFDENSQNKFLGKEVNFQGNNVPLNRLIGTNEATKMLDHSILSRMLENWNISIGDQKAFSSIGYNEDCYVERKFCRPMISEKIIKEKPAAMKLFITGADKEVLMKFGAKPDDIVVYQNEQYHGKGIIIPPSDKTNQEYNEIFQSLGDDVHWLHYSRSLLFSGLSNNPRLLWVNSKNDPLKLIDHIEDDEWLDFDERDTSRSHLLWMNRRYRLLDWDEKEASNEIALLNEIRFAEINGSLLRTIVIGNSAGMGKSTVLTSLAIKMRQLDHDKKEPTDYRWIVRINLNDFANKAHDSCLELILFDEDNTADAIEFVTKMAIPDDPKNDLIVRLQQQIFKLCFEESRTDKKTPKIVLMFDGFDEITPAYKDKTTTLIKALQTSQMVQIWVSTRVHELIYLQKELNSLGFFILPLSDDNQIEFTNKIWKWQLKFEKKSNGEICERNSQEILDILNGINLPDEYYAEKLNERISEIVKYCTQEMCQIDLEELRDAIDKLDFSDFFEGMIAQWQMSIKNNKFTINPLNLKMLSEIVFVENFQSPRDFGLSNLYGKFIEMKFNICYTEKGTLIEGNQMAEESRKDISEVSYKVHEALAVAFFFPKTVEEKNLPNLNALDRFKSNDGEKEKLQFARRGILVLRDGRLEFIHQSFAEFFFSKYLIENANDHMVQEHLIIQILVDKKYRLICDFFNKQVEKKDLCIELSEKSINLLIDHLEKNRETELPVQNSRILKLMLNAVQRNIELIEDLLGANIEGNYNVFLIAVEKGNDNALEQLLWGTLRLEPKKIRDSILRLDDFYESLLASIIHKGQNNMIKTVLRFVKDNEVYLGDGCLTDFVAVKFNLKFATIEKIKCLMYSIRDIFGVKYVVELFYFNEAILDRIYLLTELIECIKGDSEALYNFIFLLDRYGKTGMLIAPQLNSIPKIFNEFVTIFCNQVDDPNILEDLAIKSVYCVPSHNQNIDTILKIVDSNSEMHKKLILIRNNLKTIEERRRSLDTAIFNGNVHEFNKILDQCSLFDVKQILMMKSKNYGFWEATKPCKFIDNLLLRIKTYKYISKPISLNYNYFVKTPLHQAIEDGREQIVLEILEFMKEHVGVDVLRRTLFDIKPLFDNGSYAYIIEWIERNLGASTRNKLKEKGKELIAASILKTNYFGRTNFFNLRSIGSPLENSKINNILEDFTILTIYGDARANACENIDKLFSLSCNDPETLKIKSRLNYVQQKKCDLDKEICKGDKNSLVEILNKNGNVIKELMLISNDDGQTALHVSAEHNKIEIINVLLESVTKYPRILEEMVVKIEPFNGETALHVATRCGHHQYVLRLLNLLRDHEDILIKLLLRPRTEDGLSVIADTSFGEINQGILKWMKEYLDKNTFEELIREANKPDWVFNFSKATTVLSNNVRKLENFKNYSNALSYISSPIHDEFDDCSTILLEAANFDQWHSKCSKFVQMFFQNINDFDTFEAVTILSVFGDAQNNPKTIVNQLLSDVGIQNKMPEMCNILGTIEGFMDEIEREADDLNAAILSKDGDQVQTILNQSEKEGKLFLKALLLMHNNKGQTALYVAAEKNHSEIVEIFMQKAKNYPQILDKMLFKRDRFLKNTALHRAAQLGHHESVLSFLNCFKNLEQNEKILNFSKKHKNDIINSLRVALERKCHQMAKIIFEFANEYLPGVIHELSMWLKEEFNEGYVFIYAQLTCIDKEILIRNGLEMYVQKIKFLLELFDSHSKVLKKVVLDYDVIRKNMIGMKRIKQHERKEINDVFSRLKLMYDEYARSLLETDSNMYDISIGELENLQVYVNGIYDQPDKDYIKKKLGELIKKISGRGEIPRHLHFHGPDKDEEM